MDRSFLAFLFIGPALLCLGCSESNPAISDLTQYSQVTSALAKKPSPNLTGTMDLDFLGPTAPYVWNGVIDLDGHGQFGIGFIHTSGPPRDYSQASPFEEIFEVYDLGNPAIVYLAGPDVGVTTLANSTFRMNGVVEVATGPFELWLGRNVHMDGTIGWQTLPDGSRIPETAEGTFRAN
jgi:hypothetical protein